MTTKNQEWIDFSIEVSKHISHHCLAQYGDYPDKMLEGWDTNEFKAQIEEYVERLRYERRTPEEILGDILKLVHVAGMLYRRLKDGRLT